MTPELTRLLAEAFDRRPLSRAERQELADAIDAFDREDVRAHARTEAFRLARERLGSVDASELLDWLEDVMRSVHRPAAEASSAVQSEAWFSPGQDCARRIVQLAGSARRTLDVCVFTITDDRIAESLIDAHRRGVALRVITDDQKAYDLGSDIDQLQDARIPLRVDRSHFHMHHKFALVDNVRLLTGSYNWTRGAARDNEENFIITSERRLVEAFAKAFESLWTRLA